MDAEDIEELVDGFIDQLVSEFNQLGKEIAESAKHAGEEIEAMGLSQEDMPRLVFDLADSMGRIAASQDRCRMHVGNIFDILDGLDPEEEKLARAMIHEALHEFHSEINFLFFPND